MRSRQPYLPTWTTRTGAKKGEGSQVLKGEGSQVLKTGARSHRDPEANLPPTTFLKSSALLLKAVPSLTSPSPSSAVLEWARALKHPGPFASTCGRTGSLVFMARSAKPKPIQALVLVACLLLRRAGLGQVAFSPAGTSKVERQFREAGKRGDWEVVLRLHAAYTGDTGESMKVYRVAMLAAYHSSQYEEAAELYTRLRNFSGSTSVLPHGLKIFGKLRDNDMVKKIWMEIVQSGVPISKRRAATRLEAASDMGDIVGAAALLDFMSNRTVPAGTRHYNLAIRACKMSNHSRRHEAATYLLQAMIQNRLQPKVITFQDLVGAHRTEPLHQVENVLSKMSACRVSPNREFTEACVNAILEDRLVPRQVPGREGLVPLISQTSVQRQRAARLFLEDMASQGIDLSSPCSQALRYLQQRT